MLFRRRSITFCKVVMVGKGSQGWNWVISLYVAMGTNACGKEKTWLNTSHVGSTPYHSDFFHLDNECFSSHRVSKCVDVCFSLIPWSLRFSVSDPCHIFIGLALTILSPESFLTCHEAPTCAIRMMSLTSARWLKRGEQWNQDELYNMNSYGCFQK